MYKRQGEEPVTDEGREGHSIFAWHLLRVLGGVSGTAIGFDVYSEEMCIRDSLYFAQEEGRSNQKSSSIVANVNIRF